MVATATATAIVALAGSFLIGLAITTFVAPVRAVRFLDSFAGSARAHYFENLLRITVGIAMVLASHAMRSSGFFHLFGWVLIVTSGILLLLPWRWHQRYAQKVVPPLTRRVWVLGLLSLPLGAFVLFALAVPAS